MRSLAAFAAGMTLTLPAMVLAQTSTGLEDVAGTVNALQDGTPAARLTAPARPSAPAEQAELQRITQRGRQLFAIARAGRLATQDMLTQVPDAENAGIAGWLVEPEGNAVAVTFYADADGGPVAVYHGTVLGNRVTDRTVHPAANRPALSPALARMAAARRATAELDNRVCADGQPFNVLVVPPAGARDPIDVYQLTPQTARDKVPVGGHYRTRVGPSGSVSERQAFAPGCLDAAIPPVADGQRASPIAVTQAQGPLPSEVHVLTALLTGRPLVVAAGGRVWGVTGSGIGELAARGATNRPVGR